METKDQPLDPSQVPEWRSRLEQLVKEWREEAREEGSERMPGWVGAQAKLIECADQLSEVLAAALPEGEETGWRDIASAPKDGTQVWVWPSYMPAYVEAGTGLWLYAGDDEAFYPQPTHWQPLRLRRTGP